MQGTHQLEDAQGNLKYLLSAEDSTVDLDQYVGQKVRVKGTKEPTVEAGGTLFRVESVERL